MDEVEGAFDVVHGGVGEDAVAEVEDMAGSALHAVEDLLDAGFEVVPRGEEGNGVEVALDGAVLADALPGGGEVGGEVDSDDVPPRVPDQLEHAAGVDAEVDDGDAGGGRL